MTRSAFRIASGLLLGGTALGARLPSGPAAAPAPGDWRDNHGGRTIPGEEYFDQPYLIRCNDGVRLCVLATSRGGEGATSSRVVASRSTDQGRTWTPPGPLEAETPPESAYATLLKLPGGRIFACYDHNSASIREIPGENGGKPVQRVDTLGQFVFRTTEDGGAARPCGWARLPREPRMIPTTSSLSLAPALHGELGGVRVYVRRLYVSEAFGNHRAGRPAPSSRPTP